MITIFLCANVTKLRISVLKEHFSSGTKVEAPVSWNRIFWNMGVMQGVMGNLCNYLLLQNNEK